MPLPYLLREKVPAFYAALTTLSNETCDLWHTPLIPSGRREDLRDYSAESGLFGLFPVYDEDRDPYPGSCFEPVCGFCFKKRIVDEWTCPSYKLENLVRREAILYHERSFPLTHFENCATAGKFHHPIDEPTTMIEEFDKEIYEKVVSGHFETGEFSLRTFDELKQYRPRSIDLTDVSARNIRRIMDVYKGLINPKRKPRGMYWMREMGRMISLEALRVILDWHAELCPGWHPREPMNMGVLKEQVATIRKYELRGDYDTYIWTAGVVCDARRDMMAPLLHRAATTIQKQWERSWYNPAYSMCRRKLLRDYADLVQRSGCAPVSSDIPN